jgi:hypothetical protein
VGSRVYGTSGPDSDHDYVFVGIIATGRDIVFDYGCSITVFSEDAFRESFANQNVFALEAMFTPEQLRLPPFVIQGWLTTTGNRGWLDTTVDMGWKLDKPKLVANATEKSDSDFARAIRTWGDPKARKRLWHSLRVPMFAGQVLTHGRIIDYTAANDVFLEIMTDPSEDSAHFAEVWGPVRDQILKGLD